MPNSASPMRWQAPTTRCSASPRSTSSSAPPIATMRPRPICWISATSYVDQLSQLMDINVVQRRHNQVTVFTNSAFSSSATLLRTLSFDAARLDDGGGAMERRSEQANRRHASCSRAPNGGDVDLIANKSIRSGQIAAYLEMRDQVLVQAQGAARSDRRRPGERAVRYAPSTGRRRLPAPQAGFDIDLGGLQDGNTISLSYTDNVTSTQHTVTLVRVDDPGRSLATQTRRQPIRTTRSSASIFPAGLPRSSASSMRLLAPRHCSFPIRPARRCASSTMAGRTGSTWTRVSATKTITSLTGGTPELPFFLDGNSALYRRDHDRPAAKRRSCRPHRGQRRACWPTRRSWSSTRPRLLPSRGDATRPNFIYDQLNERSLAFSPQSGIGSVAAPFSGSIESFLRQVISQQGRGGAGRRQPQAGPGRRVQFAAAAIQRRRRRQHRPGNGEPAQSAERLCRQCARAVGGQGHDRHADEDVSMTA